MYKIAEYFLQKLLVELKPLHEKIVIGGIVGKLSGNDGIQETTGVRCVTETNGSIDRLAKFFVKDDELCFQVNFYNKNGSYIDDFKKVRTHLILRKKIEKVCVENKVVHSFEEIASAVLEYIDLFDGSILSYDSKKKYRKEWYKIIKIMQAQNLKESLTYAPGGPGAVEAKTHFHSLETMLKKN